MIRILMSLCLLLFSCSMFQSQFDPDVYVSQMTLQEKIDMIHGDTYFTTPAIERLGIPGLRLSDGPCGIRYESKPAEFRSANWGNDAATYFPSLTALTSTWNPDLAAKFGEVYGEEAVIRGKNIVLLPGFNINRTPLNGRNWEYMGEDPYLVTQLVPPIVTEIQKQNTAVCIKHYVLNNQEYQRKTINIEVGERALREIYLPGFKAGVDAGALSIMGAFNKFRGQHASHNDYLLNNILKKEWGFKGIVISDWDATHDTDEAAKNGLDLEMGTKAPTFDEYYMANPLMKKVQSGEIDEKFVDDKVRRILTLMHDINLLNRPAYDTLGMSKALGAPHRHAVAREMAEEGIVLLKNENKLLPINSKKIKSIAVIGDNATRKHALGGGSTTIKAKYEITPLEGIKNFVGSDVQVTYAPGYKYAKDGRYYNKSVDTYDEKLAQEALDLAKKSDLVIYIGGFNHSLGLDCEGADKVDITLPYKQDKLISELVKVNSNMITVMLAGSPFDMCEWIDDVHTLTWMSYSGAETGTALANILFGKVNPSGKLPITFPKKLSDSPEQVFGEYPGKNGTIRYNEGIYVGYRYYDKYQVEPQFPFGFGLSYTTFEYTNLTVKSKKNGDINISFQIQNTGSTKGKETAQIYVANKQSEKIDSPVKELKGFDKIALEPNESKTIRLTISKESLQYFCEKEMTWKFQPGEYQIMIGGSSRDIKLKKSIILD